MTHQRPVRLHELPVLINKLAFNDIFELLTCIYKNQYHLQLTCMFK